MARRLTPSQFRSQLRQVQSKLRQAAQKQKQAVDRYNREVRAYNQKRRRAIDEYNRAARAHNSKARANRRKLDQELRKLESLSSTSHTLRVTASARSVHHAFVEVRQRHQEGKSYPSDLYSLFEDEASNSLHAANAIDGGEVAEADEIASIQVTDLDGELEAFSADLAGRWQGALYALSPRNPDAARHFCTSARECLISLLDIAAPDDVVERELSGCTYTDDGRLTRRSKLRYLLVQKGLVDEAVEQFVNGDVDDILGLFRILQRRNTRWDRALQPE